MEESDFDQRLRDLQREYLEFLDDEEDQGIYMEKVKLMIADKSQRLHVNVNDLSRKNPERAKNLLENALEEQIAFGKALKEYVSSIDPTYAKVQEDFYVAFLGSFGNKHVTPRSLTSRYLGNLICLEGLVARVSLVRPEVVRSVHYCPASKKFMERKYTGLTSFEAFPNTDVYPTKDCEGNFLETEFGLSHYKDHQTLTVLEMPERAPVGLLPRSVDVICNDDLVDRCKPGDRVQIVGVYRCLPNEQRTFYGTLRTILIANNITQINKEYNMNITLEDVKLCKRLAKRTAVDMFELLSKSLAPSIHGHDYIKKAILCLLLGGMEKVLPNGTRLRGDINVLLIGDPSVAKSQLLRYVLQTAPRAIATTGRGSSGARLTPSVTTDPETGDRRLEAGAMVLADRGVVCIDHFDQMSDINRSSIDEAMEHGRLTVAAPDAQAPLNARCAVLAAATPACGRYDENKTPSENTGLQDTLLSKFDLLFVMLDSADADRDHRISEHVLRMHTYRNPKEKDGEVLPIGSSVAMLSAQNSDDDSVKEAGKSIFEEYDPLLHGSTRSKILTTKFMRKYFHIAKLMMPKLTQEASDAIADEYAKLRNQDMMRSDVVRMQPVTARTLETLIRLSTAHAKCRLSAHVTEQDTKMAIRLVHSAYFKKRTIAKKRTINVSSTEDYGDLAQEKSHLLTKSPTKETSHPIMEPPTKKISHARMEPPTAKISHARMEPPTAKISHARMEPPTAKITHARTEPPTAKISHAIMEPPTAKISHARTVPPTAKITHARTEPPTAKISHARTEPPTAKITHARTEPPTAKITHARTEPPTAKITHARTEPPTAKITHARTEPPTAKITHARTEPPTAKITHARTEPPTAKITHARTEPPTAKITHVRTEPPTAKITHSRTEPPTAKITHSRTEPPTAKISHAIMEPPIAKISHPIMEPHEDMQKEKEENCKCCASYKKIDRRNNHFLSMLKEEMQYVPQCMRTNAHTVILKYVDSLKHKHMPK